MKRIAPLLLVLLAACSSGGGSSSQSPIPQTTPPITTQNKSGAAITIKIGGTSSATQSNTRRPMYVSHSTSGVEVNVAAHGAGFTGVTPTETDVSPGSAACGGQTGPRTCTIYVYNLPTGTADFLINTYDQKPTNATTHAGNLLSTGETDNVTIIQGGTTNVAITLLAVPASLTGCETSKGYPLPSPNNEDASNNLGQSVATNMCVRALDAAGNVINTNTPLASGYHIVFNSTVTGLTLATTDVASGTTVSGADGGFIGKGTFNFWNYSFPNLDQTDTIAYTAQLEKGSANIGTAFNDKVAVLDEWYYPNGPYTKAVNTSVTDFQVIEAGYSGQFHASVSDATVGTVTPSVLTQTTPGSPVVFTVNLLNKAGNVTVTVTDDFGNSLNTLFNVSNQGSIGVVVHSRHKHPGN